MKFLSKVILIFAFLLCAQSTRFVPSFWDQYSKKYTQEKLTLNDFPYDKEYVVYYYDQVIDHQQFGGLGQSTFKQKYLVRDKFWVPGKGPIFFYCGNEGPVEMFYDNSGFLNNDLAKRYGALIIYVEHRYFGESLPFGDKETSYLKQHLGYLTSEQALQDFVTFLRWYKQKNCPTCQVFTFGGSYGGMLASWMRMKYPNVVNGAVASSAPILYFKNRQGLDINIFYKITTQDYQQSSIGNKCSKLIRKVYQLLDSYKQTPPESYDSINKGFKLCTPVKSSAGITQIQNYMSNAFTYMAMTNYPYETDFLKKLPGWPANTACEQLVGADENIPEEQLFDYIRKAFEVYYNYEQKLTCNEVQEDHSSDQDMSGWNILACADMVMPMESDGVHDMFNPVSWNDDEYTKMCQNMFGLTPNFNYTLEHYGGITDQELTQFSNIFFSNGMLDPWSGGSPLTTLSNSLPTVFMPLSAHHLDLREPNPQDPPTVVRGRRLEMQFLDSLVKIPV